MADADWVSGSKLSIRIIIMLMPAKRGSMQAALLAIQRRTDLLAQCDSAVAIPKDSDEMVVDSSDR